MSEFIKFIKRNFVIIPSLILIVIAYLYHLDKYNLLYHLGDEFGYWANAAYIYGYDWSGVASHNSYYSFGYSFILAPLFLIKNFEVRYIVALILNVFFQIASFLMLSSISKRLFKFHSNNLTYLISLCITLYSSNVFYSKTTLCESYLYFTYICITYLIVKICNENKWIEYILLGIIVPLIFTIHMRALSIVLSVVLFLLVEYITNYESRKKILVVFLEGIFLIIVAIVYKNDLIELLYSANETVDINNFAGQTGKIKLLFSFHGIWLMIRSMIGKIYYLLSASFFIFAEAIIWIKKQFEQKNNCNIKVSFFLIMSFLFTLAISSLYMIAESEIIDNLIYGRYNEFILGPFLLVGCSYMVDSHNNSIKQYMKILFAYLLIAFFVINNFDKVANPVIREVNIVGVSYLSYNGETCLYNGWEVVITLKVILIATIIFVLLKYNQCYIKFCVFLVVGLIWFHGGVQILEYQLHYREYYYTNTNISDYLYKNNISEITYLMNDNYEYFDSLLPDILQYMNAELRFEYKHEKDVQLENEKIFLVRKSRFENNNFSEYVCVAESSNFELYIRQTQY